MKLRSVYTRIWHDSWFRKLNALDRYLFLYLLTNDKCSYSGIYELPVSIMAFETGIDERDLENTMLPRLNPKIKYHDGWVFITNFKKFHVSTDSYKSLKGYENSLSEIPSHIKDFFMPLEAPSSTSVTIASASASASYNIHASREILSKNKENMIKYNDSRHSSDDEPIQDYETGQIIKPVTTTTPREFLDLTKWANLRRSKPLMSIPKQVASLKKMWTAGYSVDDIKKRWEYLEQQPFFKEHGFDFANVCSSFDRKENEMQPVQKHYNISKMIAEQNHDE